jgi:chaperonin GroEL (HSP60 family)
MGAQMVKEVASKTADVAGDGTTTATVLKGRGGRADILVVSRMLRRGLMARNATRRS